MHESIKVPKFHDKIFDDADSSSSGRTKRVCWYGTGGVTTKEQPRKNERTTNEQPTVDSIVDAKLFQKIPNGNKIRQLCPGGIEQGVELSDCGRSFGVSKNVC